MFAGSNPDINALASKNDDEATILVWNYHDDDIPSPAARIKINVIGLPASEILVHEFRIDNENSNSYEVWKKMGSPQAPTKEQIEILEAAGQLSMLSSPYWAKAKDGLMSFLLLCQGKVFLFQAELFWYSLIIEKSASDINRF